MAFGGLECLTWVLHTKYTLNTFVVQLYPHKVILLLFHKVPKLGWFHQRRGGLLSIPLAARFLVTANCDLVPPVLECMCLN